MSNPEPVKLNGKELREAAKVEEGKEKPADSKKKDSSSQETTNKKNSMLG